MVVIHFTDLMEPVLLGRVESLVGGATRPLAVTRDASLTSSLPTTLVTQENGCTIRVVSIDIIDHTGMVDARLARVVRLLLIMLL